MPYQYGSVPYQLAALVEGTTQCLIGSVFKVDRLLLYMDIQEQSISHILFYVHDTEIHFGDIKEHDQEFIAVLSINVGHGWANRKVMNMPLTLT